MPPKAPTAAAQRAASPQARPSQAEHIADALENPRDALDRLIGDLRSGTRFGAGEYDAAEERMQAICARLLTPFRGGGQPQAAPLKIEQIGRAHV